MSDAVSWLIFTGYLCIAPVCFVLVWRFLIWFNIRAELDDPSAKTSVQLIYSMTALIGYLAFFIAGGVALAP